jgi:hypothetical protein
MFVLLSHTAVGREWDPVEQDSKRSEVARRRELTHLKFSIDGDGDLKAAPKLWRICDHEEWKGYLRTRRKELPSAVGFKTPIYRHTPSGWAALFPTDIEASLARTRTLQLGRY